MADSAAFFDLDRTLLLRASGPTISAALRRHGLVSDRSVPIERLLFGVFDLIGETLPAVWLGRQGARAARGWPVETIAATAEELAPQLAAAVEPFALETIRTHRDAGRRLVLATTTPRDLVLPFAKLIGFDAVLATKYRSADGLYDGTIDGEFVWSGGKARSVAVWAMANRVELADSYAYSDSIFDVPMLSRVGYPVAVNPDPRLLLFATAKGWPRVWFNAPPGVPKPVGVEPQQLAASLARPELLPWLKTEFEGLENVTEGGPALLAANHRSYLDPLLLAFAGARVGRPVRFLAKKQVTDAPIVGGLIKAFGAIRVDRGSGSDRPLTEAAHALRGGELVAMFPQGTIPRGQAFFDPVLKGRSGALRLALETGTAITPVGIWGSENVWPRSARLPYVLNLANPPTVTVRFGKPYMPDAADIDASTKELMARIGDLLPFEASQPYQPTNQELARTHPGGVPPE